MSKKPNNPNGKKGGNKHQELQKELLEKVTEEEKTSLMEICEKRSPYVAWFWETTVSDAPI